MKFMNPIISGFHPDPSICRVGNDYYLVTSSFEYFPGIPVFHSIDLMNWQQIGHCITRNDQLNLAPVVPNASGIYAPTIRYHNGIFYVITTNVGGGEGRSNFFVYTRDPYGEWSDPVYIDCPGIDPSLYFDGDRVYYCGTHNSEIYLCEINIQNGDRMSDRKRIWTGTGGCCPEGPHIYLREGWYYLLISEGGTEYGHMITVARSRQIAGPYEAYRNNPILSNRSHNLPINATGHADIVEDQNGNWWAVCLGIRTICYPHKHNLGRETMLIPMEWNPEGWPVMGRNGLVDIEITTDKLPLSKEHPGQEITEDVIWRDEFDKKELDYQWNYIFNPRTELYQWNEKNGLVLYGNEAALSEHKPKAWLGRRQEHHRCFIRTELQFRRSKDNEEAGLTIYMNNNHHYEAALTMLRGKKVLIFRRQIGSLWKIENIIPYEEERVLLQLEASKKEYIFRYSSSGRNYMELGRGEAAYLTTEVGGVFTGNYIALYATGNGDRCSNGAVYPWFEYEEN